MVLGGGGFPPDIRVEKEARVLIPAGFPVSLLCLKSDKSQAEQETTDFGLEIFRVKPAWERRRIVNYFQALTICYSSWIEHIERFVCQTRPDVLHVHDFRLVPSALRAASKFGLPVVADLHENLPAALRAYRRKMRWRAKFRSLVFENYHLWRWHERRVLKRCERILVVVPEAARRLLEDYRIPANKVELVSNTEDEKTWNLVDLDGEILKSYEKEWMILYVGSVGDHRGIDTVIEAAALAKPEIDQLRVVIVGVSREEAKRDLERFIHKTGTENFISVIGWVPMEKVKSYVAASKVGLVPHKDREHTNTTVPHKLFQYMISRKPVVVSDCLPLKRIVQETGCGLVFKAEDPRDLARCLVELYHQGEEGLRKYGDKGHRAATGRYCWREDGRRLVALYSQLFHSDYRNC